MPFTFSHPAIVLPLLQKRRKIFSATGLIIGSMAPDFEAFINLSDDKIYSHTWAGMFWFDLPLAFILVLLFHAIVRDPLIDNLPRTLQERFAGCRGVNWFAYLKKHFVVVITSLMIGIFSHLLWDAFTHLNLYYPDDITSQIRVFHFRLFKILQFGCSVAGFAYIAWFIYKLPRTKVVASSKLKYQYWLIIALSSVLIGVIITTVVYKGMYVYDFLFLYIGISSFLAALIIVSLLYKVLMKKDL